MFERVVCINLESSVDRWEKFTGQISTIKNWPFGDVQRFNAYTPENVPIIKPEWFKPTPASWACYMSHLAVIRQALDDGAQSLLIFEDDAVFDQPDFPAKVKQFFSALPENWQVVYLGGNHKAPPVDVQQEYVQCRDTTLHHAWGMRGDGLRAVYNHLIDWDGLKNLTHRKQNKDQWCAEGMRLGRFAAYAPRRRWLVHQAAGISVRNNKIHKQKTNGVRTRRHVRWPNQ